MFAYVLIALEFAFLAFALWYYFLRDSKQFKVNKPIWGVYESAAREGVSEQMKAESPVLIFSTRSNVVSLHVGDDPHKPVGPAGPKGSSGTTHELGRAA